MLLPRHDAVYVMCVYGKKGTSGLDKCMGGE